MFIQSLTEVFWGWEGGGVGRELIMGGYGRANTVIGLFEKVSHMARKHHAGMQETCWDKANKELCVI